MSAGDDATPAMCPNCGLRQTPLIVQLPVAADDKGGTHTITFHNCRECDFSTWDATDFSWSQKGGEEMSAPEKQRPTTLGELLAEMDAAGIVKINGSGVLMFGHDEPLELNAWLDARGVDPETPVPVWNGEAQAWEV